MTMTCRDAAAALYDFDDGSLPRLRRQALASHVRACPACMQTLKDVRCTRRLLRRLPRERMPDPVKNVLLDELRKFRSMPDPARHDLHSHSPLQQQPASSGEE